MSDRDALLSAIAAHPDEDTPRLMYADWLDETALAEAECPTCKGECRIDQHWDMASDTYRGGTTCSACRGTGFVPSPERGHAELIRAHCEISRYKRPVDDGEDGTRYAILATRCTDLLRTHEGAWRAGPVCERCHNAAGVVEWCTHCNHTGDAGGLLREWSIEERHDAGLLRGTDRLRHRTTWDRGFISRVEVPTLSDVVERIPSGASDRYRPTSLLRQLLAPTPYRCVREIVPLDMNPYIHLDPAAFSWAGPSDAFPEFTYRLPQPIFETLDRFRRLNGGTDGWKFYQSLSAAVSALGRVIVRFGHES